MVKVLRINAGAEDISSLEEVLNGLQSEMGDDGGICVDISSKNSLKKIKVTGLDLGCAAMVYLGAVAELGEMEKNLRKTIIIGNQSLAGISAASGYRKVMQKYLRMVEAAQILQANSMAGEFEFIHGRTNYHPSPEIHNAVLASMTKISSPKHFMEAASHYLEYMKKHNAALPEEQVQNLYRAACDPSLDTTRKRVMKLYSIANILPKLNGEEFHPEEYAYRMVARNFPKNRRY